MKIEGIGNTPLRKNELLSWQSECNVYLKEEYKNLNKSAKDRPALKMIEEAITNKKIQPGGTFVEATSGNTGIAIADIARQLGYKCKIFASQTCSAEKLKELRDLGASVDVCENSNGLDDKDSTQSHAMKYAEENDDAYFTNQYFNEANYLSHFETTGPEIWEQTDGKITHFIVGVGTGGTISGVANYLKSKNPEIRIIGVEPKNSVLSYYLKYKKLPEDIRPMDPIEGIGRNFIPSIFDATNIDEILQIGIDETRLAAQLYREDHHDLVGYSSAAVLAGLDQLRRREEFTLDSHVVLLFSDHGDRYKNALYPDIKEAEEAKTNENRV